MYLFNIVVKDSTIEGKGVFALEDITKDSIVWKFNPEHDKSLSQEEFEKLNSREKEELERIGYLSPTSGMWVYPPENDPARFTNHSSTENNLVVVFDAIISSESFFRANRDISTGEELMVNYLEFDEFIKNTKPSWI